MSLPTPADSTNAGTVKTGFDPADLQLGSYRFVLPEDRIAQQPAGQRDGSRLMVLDKYNGLTKQVRFADLGEYLPENCLLVANNSRVVPARIAGTRPTGGRVEMLLLTPLPLLQSEPFLPETPGSASGFASGEPAVEWLQARADVLLRPAKKIHRGDVLDFSAQLKARLLDKGEFGQCSVMLYWQGGQAGLRDLLDELGVMPLPPYIRREAPAPAKEKDSGAQGEQSQAAFDKQRYQTIYAAPDKSGSVAAPTAGLHFTQELKDALLASGRDWAEVTLHVGYGTFSPVRSEDIRQHPMHAEYVEISAETATKISQAKAQGRAVIAVGTTSCRVLEGVFAAVHDSKHGAVEIEAENRAEAGAKTEAFLAPYAGWINIFLYPGKHFSVIDGLITNFHLPESSLLMLVSALAGRKQVLQAYQEAIDSGFRFFSYGDAMLVR